MKPRIIELLTASLLVAEVAATNASAAIDFVGWGASNFGQLSVPPGIGAVQKMACGVNHSYVIRTDGTLVGWGSNREGQLNTPVGLANVVDVDCSYHTYAVKADGSVIGWGWNRSGQIDTPVNAASVVKIACGEEHTYALRADGTIIGWGSSASGELAAPSALSDIRQVDCGGYFTCALKTNGTVLGWGRNQLQQISIPLMLAGVTQISCGFEFVYALKSDGTVACWGSNGNGQCSTPAGLSNVDQVSCGGYHTYVRKSNGEITGWGAGTVGSSGNGQTGTPPGIALVRQVVAGGFHTFALVDTDCNGDGLPDANQLGQGELADANHNNIPDVCELSVTGVLPVSGPAQGGTTITITGNNFPESPVVFIGGQLATGVNRLSAKRITAITPPNLPGNVDVTVDYWSSPEAFYYRPECGSDLDQNGVVDGGDMSILLLDWGQCYATVTSPQADAATPFMLRERTAHPAARSN